MAFADQKNLSTGAPGSDQPFFLSEEAGGCVSDYHSIATGPMNRRTRRGINRAHLGVIIIIFDVQAERQQYE
jgi:hypothetical protein